MVAFRPGLRSITKYGGYSFALRRNFGHVSAKAAVQMLGSAEINGGFSDPRIIPKFEARATVAIRLKAKALHEQIIPIDPQYTPASVGEPRRLRCFRATEYKSDATHQCAIGNDTMGLGRIRITTTITPRDIAAAVVGNRFDTAALQCTVSDFFCDLQKVSLGTGDEAFAIMNRHFQSVHHPTPSDMCNNYPRSSSQPNVDLISILNLGCDQGSDMKYNCKRINEMASGVPLLMVCSCWCFMHRYQLCIKEVVDRMCNFSWADPAGAPALDINYYTGLSAIVSVWRTAGVRAIGNDQHKQQTQSLFFVV